MGAIFREPKRYVYLVYEEIHGFVGVWESEASASRKVMDIAFNEYQLDPETPLDYNGIYNWGWDGAAWYVKEEVRE